MCLKVPIIIVKYSLDVVLVSLDFVLFLFCHIHLSKKLLLCFLGKLRDNWDVVDSRDVHSCGWKNVIAIVFFIIRCF